MGKLEELEEVLYGKEPDGVLRRRSRARALPRTDYRVRTGWGGDQAPRGAAAGLRGFRRATIAIILGALVFVVGTGAFVWWYLGGERHEAEIVIGGRDILEVGEAFTISVAARNISSAALEDADLAIALPPGSLLQGESGLEAPSPARLIERVGSLAPGAEITKEITVRLFGREGEEERVEATLLYRPEGLRARFSSRREKVFTIGRVPLDLFWDIPPSVSPRENAGLTLRYASQARLPFSGVWLRIEYPPGFALSGADPKPAVGDMFWKIGALDPGKEGRIALSGIFDGAGGEVKAFHAGLGSFDEFTKEWRPWRESVKEITLSASPFALEATINGKRGGVIRPGEQVSVDIRYENRGSVAVKNMSVRAYPEGAIADLSTLAIGSGGVFDGTSRAVVWGPGSTERLREIRPGEKGELQFSFTARPRPSITSSSDTRLTFSVRTALDAPDLPLSLQGAPLSSDDAVEAKVATVALLSGRAVFRSSPIVNSGPLPPRAGEKTTYAIVWEVRNFTNDIEEAEVRAALPPNVRWEGAVSPQGAPISYDASASEVRWRIGRAAAGAGALAPALTGAFQVSITPSEIDAGRALTLVSESRLTGRDGFTGDGIAVRTDPLTTELRDDPLTTAKDWLVVK